MQKHQPRNRIVSGVARCRYLLAGCLLLVAAPWTADFVGVKGLAGRVVVTLCGVATIAVSSRRQSDKTLADVTAQRCRHDDYS